MTSQETQDLMVREISRHQTPAHKPSLPMLPHAPTHPKRLSGIDRFFPSILLLPGFLRNFFVTFFPTTPLKPLGRFGDLMLKPGGSFFGRGGHAL
jgi:hypothetical protein